MINRNDFTSARSLLGALAEAMNLINPELSNHHEQTAYLSYVISREMSLPDDMVNLSIYSALLHDVGSVVSEKQRTIAEVERDAKLVSGVGAKMLYDLPGFEKVADVISCCQLSYDEAKAIVESQENPDLEVLRVASVVHLADRISLMLGDDESILNQSKRICDTIKKQKGTEYSIEATEAFLQIATLEYIWMDLKFRPAFFLLFTGDIKRLSIERTVRMTQLAQRIIDYRSPFTAMHSAGVAASAKKLAELCSMTSTECLMMEMAGNLHDVGKLRVPRRILEKPGKLTDEEFNIIKEHPYYTRLILMDIEGFDLIADWAGYHHEKLNGKGYPFHFGSENLDLGSRIMAVADIFSAITEERPYRKGMTKEMTVKIMKENVEYGAISGEIVDVLLDHYEEVDAIRDYMSRAAGQRYFQSIENSN